MYKAKTRVGCDGFHPKVPSNLTKETRGGIVEFLEKVEQSGNWPQQACTTMFFLIPKNVTSERPIALMPTLTRWWEALRAPEVAKWQWRSPTNCVRNFDGMDRFSGHAKGVDQGAVALVLDQAKVFERVSLPVVWAWATHFSFPRKTSRVLLWLFRATEEGAVRRMCGRAATNLHGHFARIPSGVACCCALCCRMH